MNNKLYGICPIVTAQRVLSGKWALLILFHISSGPVRFNELQRKLSGITQTTLSTQLKTLEEEGLIIRTVYDQIPPKVEYSLSEIGIKFGPVLEELRIWGDAYIENMKD